MRGWKARYITMDATPSATPRAMTAAGWTPKPLSTAPHDTSATRYASTATHTRTATPVSSGTSKKRSSIVTRKSMWDSNTKPTVTWFGKGPTSMRVSVAHVVHALRITAAHM